MNEENLEYAEITFSFFLYMSKKLKVAPLALCIRIEKKTHVSKCIYHTDTSPKMTITSFD